MMYQKKEVLEGYKVKKSWRNDLTMVRMAVLLHDKGHPGVRSSLRTPAGGELAQLFWAQI